MSTETNIPEPGIDVPFVAEAPFTDPLLHNAPGDEEYYRGIYVCRETGHRYALAVCPPNAHGRTHFLKNSAFSWEGTESEFRQQFEAAR